MTNLRTSEKDANYYSLNKDSAVWYAGTPDEQPAADPYNGMKLNPGDPKQWDAILKFSNRHNTSLADLEVAQGKENALDINNLSSGLRLSGEWGKWGDEGEQVITVKGGSSNIVITGHIHSTGKRADIVLGLWSDQSDKPSHHLDLASLFHADGRPITAILCRVDRSTVKLPFNSKILFWKSLGATIEWWAKWVVVKAGLFR